MRSRALFAVLGAMASSIATAQYEAVILHPATAEHSMAQAGTGNYQAGYIWIDGTSHATLWSGSAASLIDLHKPGDYASYILGTDGTFHVGLATPDGGTRAALWTGTSNDWVDLTPSWADAALAYGVGDGQQVGVVWLGTRQEAVVWNGTAASGVRLYPSTSLPSAAYGVAAGRQVGYVQPGTYPQAALWQGTAASLIDMTPPGAVYSAIWATDGNQHCGYFSDLATVYSAGLWTGTSNSAVPLNPAGYDYSFAYAVRNGKQAGYAALAGYHHAGVWSGSAASFVDLHEFLPPGIYNWSMAFGINTDGSIAGFAQDAVTGQSVAVVWKPAAMVTFEGFLSPLNEPPDPESSFRKGAVILVRFRLLDDQGNPVTSDEAHISVTQLGAVEVPVNESDYQMPADEGTQFRVAGGTYVYNLTTRNLVRGSRYRITATYGQGSHSVTIVVN